MTIVFSLILFLCQIQPLGTQCKNCTFTREVILSTSTEKITRISNITFTDSGKRVEKVIQQTGELKIKVDWNDPHKTYRELLKKGLAWIVVHEYDVREYKGNEPKIVEIDQIVTKGWPEKVYPTWAPGTSIEVFAEPGFTTEQMKAMEQACIAWNAAGIVQLVWKGIGRGRLTIGRQAVNDKRQAHTEMSIENEILIGAEMFISRDVTEPRALQSTVAHELGHTIGLSDCRDCKSVMLHKSKGRNKGNGYLGPTALDLAVLK